MRVVLLTPGTGSYYCGVCMRDNALAKEVIRQGHEALMLPMYLPLTLDEAPANPETPVFYGGINVYLQQKYPLFRHSPRWLDRLLNYRGFLRLAAKQSGMTNGAELGAITLSMLEGEEGKQAKELEELVQWLRGHSPDAVWISTALLAGLARRIVRELGIPVLCSLQGEDVFLDDLPEPWRRQCWDTLAERSSDIAGFIAPSRYYGDLMGGRLRLAPGQLHVIPNGIALDGFAPSEKTPLPPVIGYLARFVEGKGLGLVVDAFIELQRRGRFPDTRLHCLGAMTADDERYVAMLRKKLTAAGCAERVEFHPNVSREEKIRLLETLTLLSVPTKYGEAFGLFLLEALAAGVPVVQPRTAAFPEIVEATGGGILFDDMTAESCADAWETLLADPEKARTLGRQGCAAVAADYSIQRLAERYLDLTRQTSRQLQPQ
jgi:glycosyltransferase involved in cell wall biosynthesis